MLYMASTVSEVFKHILFTEPWKLEVFTYKKDVTTFGKMVAMFECSLMARPTS